MDDEPSDAVSLHYQVYHCHSLEEHQALVIHGDDDLNWLLRPLQRRLLHHRPPRPRERGVEGGGDGWAEGARGWGWGRRPPAGRRDTPAPPPPEPDAPSTTATRHELRCCSSVS